MKRHIALIGLSGVGKSTVARLLAAQLGWNWVDTDALIVEWAGQPIADIFATAGEESFRDLETATLREALDAAQHTPSVLATGGGIILRRENRDLLQTQAYVVWMDAPTDVLLTRLRAHSEKRPLLSGDEPRVRLDTLRAARRHLYEALADLVIVTSTLTPQQVAKQIVVNHRVR